jgi:hypothetical protein
MSYKVVVYTCDNIRDLISYLEENYARNPRIGTYARFDIEILKDIEKYCGVEVGRPDRIILFEVAGLYEILVGVSPSKYRSLVRELVGRKH